MAFHRAGVFLLRVVNRVLHDWAGDCAVMVNRPVREFVCCDTVNPQCVTEYGLLAQRGCIKIGINLVRRDARLVRPCVIKCC